MLTGRKGIAKVSSTPGKTRLINHFRVESETKAGANGRDLPMLFTWFLVDLPGYGYARLSKSERSGFDAMIRSYLLKRENLALTFLLIDSRHEAQRIDLEFMNWMGDQDIAFAIIFTKIDKLSMSQLYSNIERYRKALSLYWSEVPLILPASAVTRQGRNEILETIREALVEIS